MRLDSPRIRPLEKGEWNDEVQELMKPFASQDRVFNIFKTLANHPDLARRWMVFANHILGKSTLSDRDRELLILRIGYLCQSGYEWGQHVQISRRIGMSDEEIRSAKVGPSMDSLSDKDIAIRFHDLTKVPLQTIPLLSRLRIVSSVTFGKSRVIFSTPKVVCRISISNFSI